MVGESPHPQPTLMRNDGPDVGAGRSERLSTADHSAITECVFWYCREACFSNAHRQRRMAPAHSAALALSPSSATATPRACASLARSVRARASTRCRCPASRISSQKLNHCRRQAIIMHDESD